MKAYNFIIIFFAIIFSTELYAYDDKFLADGFWLQKDDKTNRNVSVIYVYEPEPDYVSAVVFVPLSDIEKGEVFTPMILCKNCGKGNAYGHEYDYSGGKTKFQGLEFAWQTKKGDHCAPGSKGPMYDNGAVLNPNDGKYYHLQAQTLENGDKISVRAYMGWFGKTQYWERLSQEQAEKVKNLCGLTSDDIYPYENKDGDLVNRELFEECSTRDFTKDPL